VRVAADVCSGCSALYSEGDSCEAARPWIWRYCDPSKRREVLANPHYITPQKYWIFIQWLVFSYTYFPFPCGRYHKQQVLGSSVLNHGCVVVLSQSVQIPATTPNVYRPCITKHLVIPILMFTAVLQIAGWLQTASLNKHQLPKCRE